METTWSKQGKEGYALFNGNDGYIKIVEVTSEGISKQLAKIEVTTNQFDQNWRFKLEAWRMDEEEVQYRRFCQNLTLENPRNDII